MIQLQWTWDEVLTYEPELASVERFARALSPDRDHKDWELLADMVRRLVGPMARQPIVSGQTALHVALEHVKEVWQEREAG